MLTIPPNLEQGLIGWRSLRTWMRSKPSMYFATANLRVFASRCLRKIIRAVLLRENVEVGKVSVPFKLSNTVVTQTVPKRLNMDASCKAGCFSRKGDSLQSEPLDRTRIALKAFLRRPWLESPRVRQTADYLGGVGGSSSSMQEH